MAIPATQIRRGMVIVFEGDPCRITEFRHHTPGNLRAIIQIKAKSLKTIPSVMQELEWKTSCGCAKCRPALNYYLLATWPGE